MPHRACVTTFLLNFQGLPKAFTHPIQINQQRANEGIVWGIHTKTMKCPVRPTLNLTTSTVARLTPPRGDGQNTDP